MFSNWEVWRSSWQIVRWMSLLSFKAAYKALFSESWQNVSTGHLNHPVDWALRMQFKLSPVDSWVLLLVLRIRTQALLSDTPEGNRAHVKRKDFVYFARLSAWVKNHVELFLDHSKDKMEYASRERCALMTRINFLCNNDMTKTVDWVILLDGWLLPCEATIVSNTGKEEDYGMPSSCQLKQPTE